jgi:hypothetical protein
MSAIDEVIAATQTVLEKNNETAHAAKALEERIDEALKLLMEAGAEFAVECMTQAKDKLETLMAQLAAAAQAGEEIQTIAAMARAGGT